VRRTCAIVAASTVLALVGAACTLPGVGAPAARPDGLPAAPDSGVVLPPAWTETPTSTIAPPTQTPTPTPPFGLEWATAVPVDSEFGGWVRLESKRAALWLPPGYEVVDLGEFGDMMALMAYAMTQAMGEMAGEMAAVFATPVPGRPTPTLVSLEELQQTFEFDVILAAGEADEAALFLVGEPPTPGADLGKAIEGALGSFKGEHTVVTQRVVAGRPYPTARLVVDSVDAESGRAGRHLVYVFVIGERAWSLDYVAPVERFDPLLPLFEKSAASFVLSG
jgi:hypothetical protein